MVIIEKIHHGYTQAPQMTVRC